MSSFGQSPVHTLDTDNLATILKDKLSLYKYRLIEAHVTKVSLNLMLTGIVVFLPKVALNVWRKLIVVAISKMVYIM